MHAKHNNDVHLTASCLFYIYHFYQCTLKSPLRSFELELAQGLLHCVAFFQVASLFSIEVDNQKVGVDVDIKSFWMAN